MRSCSGANDYHIVKSRSLRDDVYARLYMRVFTVLCEEKNLIPLHVEIIVLLFMSCLYFFALQRIYHIPSNVYLRFTSYAFFVFLLLGINVYYSAFVSYHFIPVKYHAFCNLFPPSIGQY